MTIIVVTLIRKPLEGLPMVYIDNIPVKVYYVTWFKNVIASEAKQSF